mmetsp:Transcript_180/g.194  ORF Transcript_180/g.194 Transcript_180/m.194 type:complete len:188 (+) Transcript_180:1210-1773(+)
MIGHFQQVCSVGEKLERVDAILSQLVDFLCFKNTLLHAQMFSLCFGQTKLLKQVKIPYELGLICQTCSLFQSLNSSSWQKKLVVCMVCAHRCHYGHFLVPLGYDLIQCECASQSKRDPSHNCKSLVQLKRPSHLSLSYEFREAQPKEPRFLNTSVSMRNVEGVITYISHDFETNTLISLEPLCELLP